MISRLILVVVAWLAATNAEAQPDLLERLRGAQKPGPATIAKAPARLSPQARAVTPHGPTVMDIRLGMPISKAEDLIRSTIRVARVLETPELSADKANPLAVRLKGRLFISHDGTERVALFAGLNAAAKNVVGVWHWSETPDDWDTVMKTLTRKRGPITTRNYVQFFWGGSASNAVCQALSNLAEWPAWREDGRAVSISVDPGAESVQPVPGLPSPGSDAASYLPCDAIVRLEQPQRRGGRNIYITRLYDMGVLSWLLGVPLPRSNQSVSAQEKTVPYGPDVVGLRLGMGTEQAELLVRQQMPVGRVFEYTPSASVNTHDPLAAYLHGKVFVSEDGADRIAIFDAPPYKPGSIVRVERALVNLRAQWEEALASLKQKYGLPNNIDNSWHVKNAVWGDSVGSCGLDHTDRWYYAHIWENWMEGDRIVPQRGPDSVVIGSIDMPKPPPLWSTKRSDYNFCGPSLRADYGDALMSEQLKMLTVKLYDQKLMAWLLSKPRPQAGAAAPAPNLKF